MSVMHAQLIRAVTLAALTTGLAGAQTRLAVPSVAVSAAAVQVSGAIGGRIIACPSKLNLSGGAVCLLASGNASSMKTRISQKFAGAVSQDWQTSKGGSNSLVVTSGGGLVFVLLAQAGPDVLAVVAPPTRGASSTATTSASPAATPAAAAMPAGATRGVPYAKAGDLRGVTSVTVLNSGQYRVGSATRFITFTPGSAAGQLAGAPYTLPGVPYLAGGQLYVPVTMLRELGCTVTATAGQPSATVACGGATAHVTTSTY